MFKTYLKRRGDGRMECVTRGLTTDALMHYQRLLARDDLAGQPWAAVLRNDLTRRTVLFSRFDRGDQRLLFGDDLTGNYLMDANSDADENVRRVIAARR